jgi:arylsulfatase A
MLCRLVCAFALLQAAAAVAAERPNVVLILTDDQGYGDLSLHGNPVLETPHLDRLGRESVRLDNFHVSSVCAPTRASLLTGRYTLRTGTHGVTHNREVFRAREVTIAEALRGAGWRTGFFGKWHNGEQYPHTPTGQGFDEFLGFTNGHINAYFDAVLLRGAKPEPTRGFITDVLTDAAIEFIERRAGEPFFCHLSYNAPHSPYQVPDREFDKYKARGLDDTLAAFYGLCENVDANVGRLLRRLEELGLAGNTVVVFLTDNGGTAGVKHFNAGMRGGKTSVHEGGARVPCFLRWPAAGWQSRALPQLAAHLDLYPTLLDLCGVIPPTGPPIDGRSLRPLLEGRVDDWPERTLFFHNPIDETNRYPAAVRTGTHRLVREIPGPAAGSAARANDAGARPWQLYDMLADPGQKHNLARAQPELVERLAKAYQAWFADVTREGRERLPLPVGHAGHDPVELHAPQAHFIGGLRFHAGPGFAHDWITGWTSADARLWFDVEVIQAGDFAVEIDHACAEADAGSLIRVRAGEATVQALVIPAPIRPLVLPTRDAIGRERYQSRVWGTLEVGQLSLAAGRQTLTVEVARKAGSQVMDFKQLRLRRL